MPSYSLSDFAGKVQPILKHGDPVLRQVCIPFDWDDRGHMQGLADLCETLVDSPRARGLAANQIGFLARAFVMRMDGKVLVMVNPRVRRASATVAIEEEECMSFPNLRVKVARPIAGDVSFEVGKFEMMDYQGLDGWDFRCFLHELDHLNGITIDLIRRKQKA